MTSTTQNYILYRTAALMYQPGYSYTAGTTPVVPAAQVSSAAGTVIATQQLTSLTREERETLARASELLTRIAAR